MKMCIRDREYSREEAVTAQMSGEIIKLNGTSYSTYNGGALIMSLSSDASDVYKRHQINLRQGQTQSRGCVTDGLVSLGPVVRLRGVLVAGDDCPVSYTHLDVYKRQFQYLEFLPVVYAKRGDAVAGGVKDLFLKRIRFGVAHFIP